MRKCRETGLRRFCRVLLPVAVGGGGCRTLRAIRAETVLPAAGAAISRAQLIRALLDAVADADVDLTTATSENDLKATILARLGKVRSGA